MSKQDMYTDLCKKCYVKIYKPTKKEISKIVLTDYKEKCDCCHRTDFLVDYVEDCYD
nr:MAG TPA: cytochrome C6 [Caudoviricetes sp.]